MLQVIDMRDRQPQIPGKARTTGQSGAILE